MLSDSCKLLIDPNYAMKQDCLSRDAVLWSSLEESEISISLTLSDPLTAEKL